MTKKSTKPASAAAKPAATKKALSSKKKAATKPVASKKPVKSEVTNAPLASVSALSKRIAKVLDTNKAEDIVTINIRNQSSFADYMIIASGRAPRHVSALADYVADLLKKEGTPALSIEGKETGDWVLIDAGDIVVHLFRPEVRSFYNLEKMWTIPTATLR